MSSRLRLLLACLATAVIVVPLGWMWWASLMPGRYSVMDMGYVDLGGGPAGTGRVGADEMSGMTGEGGDGDAGMAHGASDAGRDVDISTLVGDTKGTPDVRLHLTAREERFELASGREVNGYTLNGTSPGPTLHATQGDLVEVRLTNADIDDGITLHWHGIDVPNAMDGVAGVTQDAVAPGQTYTYRFRADQAGTYWYHSHQVSHEQVRGGLFGGVVIDPAPAAETGLTKSNVTALVHLYDGIRTVNGHEGALRVPARPGTVARVRLVNTDNGPMTAWVSGTGYRVAAVDGTDLNQPDLVVGKSLVVTAGGRADLELVVPDGGARVEVGGTAVVLGPAGAEPAKTEAPKELVDLLTYGRPAATGIDPAMADRRFDYVIGRRPGFHDGRPGLWWTINGHLWPDVPMYSVRKGDLVVFRIKNDSSDVHPMHLHGHHALVISRDGKRSTGSPWWVDSLNVLPGESYEIAFRADNPGVWMDHCHNLPHAAEGLVAHLMYAGYSTPFEVGGNDHNEPE